MSGDERALLSAIEANPADDVPRLVYADWLDEHGFGVRAEFVRLQCEIAKKETLPRVIQNRYVDLWKRQQELLDHHLPDLLGPGNEALAGFDVRFERGFPVDLSVPVEEFLAHGVRLAALRPLPRIDVTNVGSQLQAFTHLPDATLHCVTGIEIQSSRSAYAHELSPDDVIELRAAGGFPRLATLHMEGCRIGDGGVEELVASPAVYPVLTDIDLSHNDITDAGVITLLNSGLLHRLTRLILGGNPLGDQAALDIADRLGPNHRLESLNLRFTNITHHGQIPLFHLFGGRVDFF